MSPQLATIEDAKNTGDAPPDATDGEGRYLEDIKRADYGTFRAWVVALIEEDPYVTRADVVALAPDVVESSSRSTFSRVASQYRTARGLGPFPRGRVPLGAARPACWTPSMGFDPSAWTPARVRRPAALPTDPAALAAYWERVAAQLTRRVARLEHATGTSEQVENQLDAEHGRVARLEAELAEVRAAAVLTIPTRVPAATLFALGSLQDEAAGRPVFASWSGVERTLSLLGLELT